MAGRSFLDSNILTYTDDTRAPIKQSVALELVARCRREGKGVISTQVLQEYFVTTTRKLGVQPDLARRKVQLFAQLGLVLIGAEDILAAIDLVRLQQLSFWDALIVRAALRGGCSTLYSEDLQTGRKIDGMEIVNPFA